MMNVDQVGNLLKVLAAYDGRNVGPADVMVWGRQIAEFDYADVEEAIHVHYAETDEWAKPSHIRTLAEKIRNARTKRPEVVAPGCFEPDPEVRRRLGTDAESRLALAAGTDVARTVRVPSGPAAVHEVLAAIRRRLAAEQSPAVEMTPSDEILHRARERAAAERRGRQDGAA